ncbi:polyprenyl synthetase family protein [Clostridium tyrobutyricum]|jgi:geranylgeranyl diphosphate synthase type II|uniref:Farnesyl diphosphate synthase n=1 Tax=Clostridium tyrobutyricum DIVETGP TaxID=1408889 RepID=W6N2I3_CLOTY|nr:farnesyl diphosphate synthase [Clostridium tyrobutyricum]AND85202.1 geranylgeranyl pyrophosphate synthase [Clostridium tyrobutyricum]ANP69760.1 farnesyl-diphosphate synthase [Clostridium tyrobutyricum]MBR9646926.1 polyprenyl synthetase family protein [Clostridium tyrobutyricum]MBV4415205.1 polyprenyl synthetase family protein [Clostridium tyrobutyricum]MBV4420876.1 polyprenyl synthetase family protein [Clostridium tyrobutyricum]
MKKGNNDMIENLRQELNSYLHEYMSGKGSYNKKIYEAMQYSLDAGGKRIRPILFLLTYMIYKKEYRNVMEIAAAIEMIHTYSLIHDDLPSMDNDDLRRGKPTNHKVFGEGIAVLAGDGLLNEGMSLMFKHCLKDTNKNKVNACSIIAESAGVEGMVGGQTVDLLSEGAKIPIDQLYYMHSKKTGALIKAAIVSAAVYVGASEDEIDKLSYYGKKIGLAFQIKDDILDVTGDTKKLGKKVKSDANNNKTNFITTYGLNKCMEMCNSITSDCVEVLRGINRDTHDLERLTVFLLNREN